MKIGYFILKEGLREDPHVSKLLSDLLAAATAAYEIRTKSDVRTSSPTSAFPSWA